MCELKAYVRRQGKTELFLEAVNYVRAENGDVVVRNLFGEEKHILGTVSEVSLTRNQVIVEQA